MWIDKYDIRPGDSLIRKIFEEGLAQSDFFLILLSAASTQSKWVTEELDAAMINKIEGITKIIPLLKEACTIPPQLRSLVWVDLSTDYTEGIRTLVKTMYGVFEKPPVSNAPEYVTTLRQSVGGLSSIASTLGSLLLSTKEDESGYEVSLSTKDLESSLPNLSPDEINDAVDELESYGLAKAHKVYGNAPYYFIEVSPTYALYLHFKNEGLDYDPEEDIRAVAAAVVAKNSLTGDQLREIVPLSPGRLNRAVAYLEDYGHIRVIKTLGTAPYDFRELMATRLTRQFVQNNS